MLDNREQIPFLLNELNLNGEGVEVGVGGGTYSYELLKNSNLKRLYSIDVWSGEDGCITYATMKDYVRTVQKLWECRERSTILVLDSLTACDLFEDASLDFIYIDAMHGYEHVKQDILAWLPKVKKGGIISGHDYFEYHAGVVQAVDEIFLGEIQVTECDFDYPDKGVCKSWIHLK